MAGVHEFRNVHFYGSRWRSEAQFPWCLHYRLRAIEPGHFFEPERAPAERSPVNNNSYIFTFVSSGIRTRVARRSVIRIIRSEAGGNPTLGDIWGENIQRQRFEGQYINPGSRCLYRSNVGLAPPSHTKASDGQKIHIVSTSTTQTRTRYYRIFAFTLYPLRTSTRWPDTRLMTALH